MSEILICQLFKYQLFNSCQTVLGCLDKMKGSLCFDKPVDDSCFLFLAFSLSSSLKLLSCFRFRLFSSSAFSLLRFFSSPLLLLRLLFSFSRSLSLSLSLSFFFFLLEPLPLLESSWLRCLLLESFVEEDLSLSLDEDFDLGRIKQDWLKPVLWLL